MLGEAAMPPYRHVLESVCFTEKIVYCANAEILPKRSSKMSLKIFELKEGLRMYSLKSAKNFRRF